MGAERLFENAPKVEFGEVTVGDDKTTEAEEPSGTFTVTVAVKDGENAVAVAAEKVSAMFEATSDIGDWDGAAKLTPIDEMLGVSDVVMRFRVTPGTSAPSAFLRIRK